MRPQKLLTTALLCIVTLLGLTINTNAQILIGSDIDGEAEYNHSGWSVSSGKLQFAIPGEAGIYFIEVNADNRKALLKVVKE
ncbi:MAG: hypothetical protein KJ607_12075 [Bacteroidetes bacterium]|nr:hypothetical protein [Bacteroidota bacterium]